MKDTLLIVFVLLLYWVLPFIIIYLTDRFSLMKKVGEVIFAYIAGLIIGHSGILPPSIDPYLEYITYATIPLAIPLMLFGGNTHQWKGMASSTFFAILTGVLALTIMVVSGFFIFSSPLSESYAKAGGLFMGLYTGGLPNLAALQFILDANQSLYLTVNAYDMVVGSVYLIFLMTLGGRFFSLFMRPFIFRKESLDTINHNQEVEPLWGLANKHVLKPLLFVLGVAIVIVAIAGGVMTLLPANAQLAVFMLLITSLAILASLIKRVRETKRTFELGMYFVLVFSTVIASKVNVFDFKIIDFSMLAYMAYVMLGTLLLHSILAYIFKVDRDTFMVASVALICSPPFVPLVASSINNRQVILAGITIGIIGYAIGNYLGVLVYHLLMTFVV